MKFSCSKMGGALIGFAALAFTSTAQAQRVINFDTLSSGTVVTNEYSGITFTGAQVLTTGTSLSSAYPPHSGSNVIYDYLNGVIQVNFATPVTDVGGYITGNTTITEEAFDASNNLLGSVSTGGANYIGSGGGAPNQFLNISASNIAYVRFHDSGNTFTLDDLTIRTAAVPELSTMLGFGSFVALGGLAAFRQRKQARKAA